MMTRTVLLAAALHILFTSHVVFAQPPPAKAALDECRTLVRQEVFPKAVERCEQAVQLNPQSADAHFRLASAHHQAFQAAEPSPEENAQKLHNRSKAVEHYNKSLALSRDAAADRSARRAALAALLGLYVSTGETGVEILAYAKELEGERSLSRRELSIAAGVYANNGRPERSETLIKRLVESDPSDAEACQWLATLYNLPVWNGSTRFDMTIATLERCAARTPKDPGGYHTAATFLWEKAYRDAGLDEKEKLQYIDRGLVNVDRALALEKDFLAAILYKGLLIRLKAMVISDLPQQRKLIAEADMLQTRAMELKKAGVPPPLPAPPPPPSSPVRVGGEITPPEKLKHVTPVYPLIAQSARVQGAVIVECTIGADGTVVDVKVLTSIPLLDAAAVDAVKQWVFTPTLRNGIPVPVIMTTTVTFTLK